MFETMRFWGATAAVAVCLAGPASAETLNFKFKTPADADGWQAIQDKWKVKNKAYQALHKNAGYPVSLYGEKQFKDVDFSFRFKTVKVEGTKYQLAGSLIRTTTDSGAVSGYLALVQAAEAPDVDVEGSAIIYKVTDLLLNGGSGEADVLCSKNFIAPSDSKGEILFKADG